MTKKDYKMLAHIIANIQTLDLRKQLARDIGRKLEAENRRFRMDRWLDACGVTHLIDTTA